MAVVMTFDVLARSREDSLKVRWKASKSLVVLDVLYSGREDAKELRRKQV